MTCLCLCPSGKYPWKATCLAEKSTCPGHSQDFFMSLYRDSNPTNWKKGRFVEQHSCAHEGGGCEPLRGSKDMLSQEKFQDMFLYKDAISCILRSQSMENSGIFNISYWSLSHQYITAPKFITGSCLDAKRVKMAEKPLKNSKESSEKKSGWTKKTLSFFARKSFKNRENSKLKGRPEMFA